MSIYPKPVRPIHMQAQGTFVPLIRNGLARVTAPSSSVHPPFPPHGLEPVTRASLQASAS